MRWCWGIFERGWASLGCRDLVFLVFLFGVAGGLHVGFWVLRRIHDRERRDRGDDVK